MFKLVFLRFPRLGLSVLKLTPTEDKRVKYERISPGFRSTAGYIDPSFLERVGYKPLTIEAAVALRLQGVISDEVFNKVRKCLS